MWILIATAHAAEIVAASVDGVDPKGGCVHEITASVPWSGPTVVELKSKNIDSAKVEPAGRTGRSVSLRSSGICVGKKAAKGLLAGPVDVRYEADGGTLKAEWLGPDGKVVKIKRRK